MMKPFTLFPVARRNMNIIRDASGFTLVELGMVLIVVSFIIGPIFTYLTIQTDRDNYQETIVKQRRIAIALSDYAQLHGYLPCPSRPTEGTGIHASRTIGEEVPVCDTHELRNGIIPFRTLGLMPSDVIDGYGNLFSYAVSEIVNDITTVNPNAPPDVLQTRRNSNTPAIHEDCRRYSWNADDVNIVTGEKSELALQAEAQWRKATFCCREMNTGGAALDVFSNAARTRRPIATQDREIDVSASASLPLFGFDKQPLRYIAYVLVSHGKNGRGSFRYGSPTASATSGAGSAEIINATRDNSAQSPQFIDIPINRRAGNDYFDDIVLWRTQESTIAETGNNSCMTP